MYGWKLTKSIRHLRKGQVIAHPTEAVYGLACDPFNEMAVTRILTLKQRSTEKGFILIAADFAQLAPLLILPDKNILDWILDSWPGAITWIFPAKQSVPVWLTGQYNSLAVRVTHHPLSSALSLAYNKPLVSTSANPSHRPPAQSAIQVRRYFSDDQLLILPGRTSGLRTTTPIYDAMTFQRLR